MPEPETWFDTIRQKAAATAMGDTADTEGGAPGGDLAIRHQGIQKARTGGPEGELAKLFKQAGVNIAEAELDALMQLPDDQFAEALRTLPQPQKPEIDVPAVLANPEATERRLPHVDSPEYGAAFAKHMQRRGDAAGAPPQGFTVDPQDPTIFIAPDGRRFRALE